VGPPGGGIESAKRQIARCASVAQGLRKRRALDGKPRFHYGSLKISGQVRPARGARSRRRPLL